jgi:hypothetical protein
MSGHIPLQLSNYTPYTPIYQQNFGDWSRLLIPFWSSCFWKLGLVSSSEPTDSELQGYRGAGVAGLKSRKVVAT